MKDSTYAWIIDKDHLADEWQDPKFPSRAGLTGPSNAPDHCIAALENGGGYTFRMYDDDGELYFTGRCTPASEDALGSDAFCYGPLGDFGMPDSGAVVIKYTNHPEWGCG